MRESAKAESALDCSIVSRSLSMFSSLSLLGGPGPGSRGLSRTQLPTSSYTDTTYSLCPRPRRYDRIVPRADNLMRIAF